MYKSGLLLLLVFLVLQAMTAMLPYWNGNEVYHDKRLQLLTDSSLQGTNTLFIGTSHVYRQLDPAVFDTACRTSQATRSYNLAVNALFTPESNWLYRQMLNDDFVPNLKYVILEVGPVNLSRNVINTKRGQYWLTSSQYLKALWLLAHSSQSFQEKNSLVSRLSSGWIHHCFANVNGSDLQHIFGSPSWQNQVYDVSNLGKGKRGCQFLEERIEEEGEIKTRRARFLNDTSNLEVLRQEAIEAYSDTFRLDRYNSVHLGVLQELIRISDERNVHLIFFVAPQSRMSWYREIRPLLERISPDHYIDMANPWKNPEFYQVSYSFDGAGHLNTEGSALLTRRLAKAFSDIVNVQKQKQ